ncbi:MAG: hypothetical protein KBS55_03825 [Bacteroidales bacterium]|nr:hypothetical protein [Candidatus Cryptobacteroides aphodequi]
MEKITQLECIDYIPPQADILHVNCQKVLCQSGEVPDMQEGWKFDI